MPTYVLNFYREPDATELEDVQYACCAMCMLDAVVAATGKLPDDEAGERRVGTGSVSWGQMPGGEETQSDVFCTTCEDLMWRGLGHHEASTPTS